MSLRTDLLQVAESFRSLTGPDFADIRINQLTIRTRTWSGARLGEGTATDADLVLPRHYPIRYLSAQEIFSDAGEYESGDILVDHITPSDGQGNGYTREQLHPTVTADNVELLYIITGTAEGDGHDGDYRCIDVRTYKAFTSQLVLRRRGETP